MTLRASAVSSIVAVSIDDLASITQPRMAMKSRFQSLKTLLHCVNGRTARNDEESNERTSDRKGENCDNRGQVPPERQRHGHKKDEREHRADSESKIMSSAPGQATLSPGRDGACSRGMDARPCGRALLSSVNSSKEFLNQEDC